MKSVEIRKVECSSDEVFEKFGGSVKVKVKSSMARSLPVENLLPQNVG